MSGYMTNYLLIGRNKKYFINLEQKFDYSLSHENKLEPNKLPYFTITNEIDDVDADQMIILPNNCRFFYRHNYLNCLSIVIEEEPKFRTIKFKRRINSEYRKLKDNKIFKDYENLISNDSNVIFKGNLRLFFPYSIFYFLFEFDKYDNCYLQHINFYYGVRKSPLKSIHDIIYYSPLMNIGQGLNVCTGHTLDFEVKNINESIIEKIITLFWQTEFNNDLEEIYIDMMRKQESKLDIFSWDYYSKKDPMFILNENFKPYKSLKEIITQATSSKKHRLHENIYYNNLGNFLSTYIPGEVIIKDKLKEKYVVKRKNEEIEVNNKRYIIKEQVNDYELTVIDEEGNDKIVDYNFIKNIEKIDNIIIKNNDNEDIKICANYFMINKTIKNVIKQIHEVKISKTDNLILLDTTDNLSYIITDDFLENWDIIENFKTRNGIKLKAGKEIYFTEHLHNVFLHYENPCVIDKIEIRHNDIYLFINSPKNQNWSTCVKLSDENIKYSINEKLKIDKNLFKDNFVLYGNLVYGDLNHKMYYNNSETNIHFLMTENKYKNKTEKIQKVKKIFFNEDCTKFKIPSFIGNDYELSVNDDVLFNINNKTSKKLKVKSFKIDVITNSLTIYVNLEEKNDDGTIKNIDIILLDQIFLEKYLASIEINLRKVTYNHEKYPEGTRIKIKSNKRSLKLPFSKYNCYEIFCVITDSILPMAFLTNDQTVYLMDIPEYFDVLYPNDKGYDKKVITKPNLNIQWNDFVKSSSLIYFIKIIAVYINIHSHYNCSLLNLDGTNFLTDTFNVIKKQYVLYGIQFPRFITDDLIEVPNYSSDFRNILVPMKQRYKETKVYHERRIIECLKS